MLINKRKTNTFSFVFWGMVYWIALTISYVWSLQKMYSSTFPLELNIAKYILSTITVFIMLLAVPSDESITNLCITIILYLVIIPLAIIYSCQNKSTLYYISVSMVFVLVEIIIKYVSPQKIKIRMRDINFSNCTVILMLIVLAVAIIIMFKERGVPSFDSMDFSITYEIRSSYTLSSLASRLFQISTKAIIPFLIAVYFIRRKYKRVVFLLLVQFVFFLWLANKTTIFSIGVLVLGYLIGKAKNGKVLFSKIMSLGMITISIGQGVISGLSDGLTRIVDMVYSLIVRRSIILPAYLKYCYYDYFVLQNNPHEGFFGTIIAPILTRLGIRDPYEAMSYTRVLGNKYYIIGSSVNTGIFGGELAHFGYFGILLAGILLVLLLLSIKKSEVTNGKVFTCCLSIYMVIGMTDSGVIQLIDFSPMLLITLILFFYEIDEHNIEDDWRRRIGFHHTIRRMKY